MTAKKYFVVLREEGCVPEKKGGWPTREAAIEFVRECAGCRPASTLITLLTLTWDDDLWAECGREALHIDDVLTGGRRRVAGLRP